ncbi:spore coat associated protein CotJA [Melghirimyces algeriensis]
MWVKTYETPPQLYLGFQPYGMPQFPPMEALRWGTLWPALFAPYSNPYKQKRMGGYRWNGQMNGSRYTNS